MVLRAHGVSRPRTVKRLVNERKWRSDLVEKVTTLPWGEDVAKEEEGDHAEKNPVPKGESVPLEAQEGGLPEQPVRDQHPEIRGLYLRRGDFTKHGWT